MDRKVIWIVLIFGLLISLGPAARAVESQPDLLFGNTLAISSWHIHLSHHRFAAAGGGSATLKLTQLDPPGAIRDGIITLNGRFIHLRTFFSGTESSWALPVTLNEDNSMIVFLWGDPGSSLRIEVLAGPAAEAAGLGLAERIRDGAPGVRVETNCGGGSFKSQLKRADKSGARVAVIVGDDEASRRVAAVKALRGVEAAQREVSFDELAAELGRELQAKSA